MARAFVSYSHKDSALVEALVAHLAHQHDIVIDTRGIIPNIPLSRQIETLIESSKFMIVVISGASVRSDWVKREIDLVYEESMTQKVQLIPFVIGGAKLPLRLSIIPYVVLDKPDESAAKEAAFEKIAKMISRPPLVGGRLVLGMFSTWGHLAIEEVDQFSLILSNSAFNQTASGFGYHDPIYTAGFTTLCVTIGGSSDSEFVGYSSELERQKMLKVEIDGHGALVREATFRAIDDADYLRPTDGEFHYDIPEAVRASGAIHKIQFVFGAGRIRNLRFSAYFA